MARRERKAVPPWAAAFDLAGFHAFVEAVEEVLLSRELDTTREGGVVAIRLGDSAPLQLGLRTLAQQCAGKPREAWIAHIAGHLDAVLAGSQQAQHLHRRDFEGVRPLLKVRLYAAALVDEDPDLQLVARRPAEDLVAALCYDLPRAVASVLPEDAAAWGQPEDALFDLALGNLAAEPFTQDRMEVERGVTLEALHGPSLFVAAQLLRLEALLGAFGAAQVPESRGEGQGGDMPSQGGPPSATDCAPRQDLRPCRNPQVPRSAGLVAAPAPRHGYLCAVPTRHLVLFHRIRDARMLVALNALMAQAWLQYQKGPGSLSPSLYWLHQGELLLLPTEVTRRGFTFRPPPAFVEAVMTPLGSESPS